MKSKRVSRAEVILDELDILILAHLPRKKHAMKLLDDLKGEIPMSPPSWTLHLKRLAELGLIFSNQSEEDSKYKLLGIFESKFKLVNELLKLPRAHEIVNKNRAKRAG